MVVLVAWPFRPPRKKGVEEAELVTLPVPEIMTLPFMKPATVPSGTATEPVSTRVRLVPPGLNRISERFRAELSIVTLPPNVATVLAVVKARTELAPWLVPTLMSEARLAPPPNWIELPTPVLTKMVEPKRVGA